MDICEKTIRTELEKLGPECNDALCPGDLGVGMIEYALDELAKRLNLTNSQREYLSDKISVGVVFKYETD